MVEELGEQAVEAAAGGLHRDQRPVLGGDEQAAQGGLRGRGGAGDEGGAQGGGQEPGAGDQAGFGAVAEQGLDPDDEVDPHRRASAAGSWPVMRAARVSARTCPPVRTSPSARAVAAASSRAARTAAMISSGQGGGDLSGAVVEAAGGDPAVGAGSGVAAGLGVGGVGQARPADRLAEPDVAEPDQPTGQVRIHPAALLGGEVRDLPGDGEGPVLGRAPRDPTRPGSAGGRHAAAARAAPAARPRADSPRSRGRPPRRSTSPAAAYRRPVTGTCSASAASANAVVTAHLGVRDRGLDPLQRLELVEVIGRQHGRGEVGEEICQGVELACLPGGGGLLRLHLLHPSRHRTYVRFSPSEVDTRNAVRGNGRAWRGSSARSQSSGGPASVALVEGAGAVARIVRAQRPQRARSARRQAVGG